jgi:hypothetical protein
MLKPGGKVLKRKIAVFVACLLLLAAGMAIKKTFFVESSRFASYYFLSFFMTVTMLMVVTAVGIFIQLVCGERPSRSINSAPDPSNKRDAYRVTYPAGERPRLTINLDGAAGSGERLLEVFDISEYGMKLLNKDHLAFDGLIRGEMVFPKGETLFITGRALRIDVDTVGVQLLSPISYDLIIREQRRLITKSRLEEEA